MGVLFRYELKKLFSRKLVWILLLLCAGLVALANAGSLNDRRDGSLQGMRDVYGLYEGRVLTDALKAKVKADYEEYVSSRPDHFRPTTGNDATADYLPKDGDYYGGVWQAYQDIMNGKSVEDVKRFVADQAAELARGKNEDGSPFTPWYRQELEDDVRNGCGTPAVHYMEGWKKLIEKPMDMDGMYAIFVIVLGLLPLFTQESSSRMEGVLLSAAGRGRAALAKVLTSAAFTALAVSVCFGVEAALVAVGYGLDGATLPKYLLTVYMEGGGPSIGAAFALVGLAILLSAVCTAALVAWASARFRNPLFSLLVAGAAIAAQYCLYNMGYGGNAFLEHLVYETGWHYVWNYIKLLPLPVLAYPGMLPPDVSDNLAFLLGFPAAASALLFWLAPRCFLKQRKV